MNKRIAICTTALIAGLYLPFGGTSLALPSNCGWFVPITTCPDTFDPPPCQESCSCPVGFAGPRGGPPGFGGAPGLNNPPSGPSGPFGPHGGSSSTAALGSCSWCGKGIADFATDGSGMPVYWISPSHIDVRIEDTPLSYSAGLGRDVVFHLSYRQRGAIPEDPSVFGVGTNWSCSFRSFLVDLTGGTPGWLRLHRTGAGLVDYTNGVMQARDGSTLTGSGSSYQIVYQGGSTDIFQKAYTDVNGTNFYFLTAQADPAGNTTRYTYSNAPGGVIQLLTVTDADGKTTTLHYDNTSLPLRITRVTDPFNRTCILQYDPASTLLTTIVDVIQLTNTFQYSSSVRATWIASMTTPYGTTSFTYGGCDADLPKFFTVGGGAINRSVQVTLPNNGNELYLYRQDCSAFMPQTYSPVPSTTNLANTFDNVDQYNRNSFHWGPLQYSHLSSSFLTTGNPTNLTAGDYAIGQLYHWLADPADPTGVQPSSTVSLEQAPSPDGSTSGQLTWYDYDGKTSGNNFAGTNALTAYVALVLPDGTTRFTHDSRGAHGQVTQEISTYTTTSGSVGLRTNTFIYAANNVDLLQQIGPLGEQVVSNYFATGNTLHEPNASYDALNQATVYTYNTPGQVISVVSPAGLTTTNIYFATATDTNRLQTAIDLEISRTNSFTYTNGLVSTHTDERQMTVTNFWDNLQRLTRSDYPDGSSISNLYTILDLTDTKDRLGYWTHYGYNQIRQKIAETNANGTVTRYGYCSCGALQSITNAWSLSGFQAVTTFGYDIQGNVTNTVGPDLYSVTNSFNKLAQLTNTIDGWGSRYFFYNNQGLPTLVSNAFGIERGVVFDIEDREQFVTNANNVTITNTFDTLNRLLTRGYPDGGVEKFGYSARGLIAYTNQIGASNFFAYDAGSRKIFETNADNQLIQYTFNAASDFLTLTDGKSQTTTWHPDQFGRVTNKLDQAGTEVLRYQYDPDDRLTNRWSVAKGNTTYRYDPVGNLTNIVYPVSPSVVFQYDPLNRLTNMVDAAGTTVYSYTAAGQLFTEDGPFASDTVTNTYQNRLRTALSLQQPTGSWTNGFGYDAAKRLTNVTSQAGSFGYTYVANLPSLLVRKLSLPNTSYITNNFDSVGRVLNTSLNNSANTALDSFTYVYDPANERTNLTRAGANGGGWTVAYTYDNIGQLTIANGDSRGYVYDNAWNLIWLTNGTASQFSVNGLNEVTNWSAAGASSYDANGNLTNKALGGLQSPNTYIYDDENRLIDVQNPDYGGGLAFETVFIYDGLGRLRIRREYWSPPGMAPTLGLPWVGETHYIYDGMRVIQERDTNNVPVASYTRGIDLSGSLEGAGGIGGLLGRSWGYSAGNWTTNHYYHCDGNGNITYLEDSSQALAASYRYDPFGNVMTSLGVMAGTNLYRFSTKEIHAISGMYYFGYRFYDPSSQRWINRDPIGEAGEVNLYAYVGNSPLNYVDPYGLLTAVVIGGPSPPSQDNSSGNPFGHASIATTGQGVYSFGTGTTAGSSFTDFLNKQATYRDSTVYILNTTPDQEKAINDYLKSKKGKPMNKYPDNCGRRTADALKAGGVAPPDLTRMPHGDSFDTGENVNGNWPALIGKALENYPGVIQTISVPKGTTSLPNSLTDFNPKQ